MQWIGIRDTNLYPLDRGLSSGERYLPFEQLGRSWHINFSDFFFFNKAAILTSLHLAQVKITRQAVLL